MKAVTEEVGWPCSGGAVDQLEVLVLCQLVQWGRAPDAFRFGGTDRGRMQADGQTSTERRQLAKGDDRGLQRTCDPSSNPKKKTHHLLPSPQPLGTRHATAPMWNADAGRGTEQPQPSTPHGCPGRYAAVTESIDQSNIRTVGHVGTPPQNLTTDHIPSRARPRAA